MSTIVDPKISSSRPPIPIGQRPAPTVLMPQMPEGAPGGDDLLLPDGSSLALSVTQLQFLLTDTLRDYETVKSGMDTWRTDRKRYLQMFEKDYSYRETKDEDQNVFNHSNLSLDLCKNDGARVAGRLQRELIDTWPFFTLTPYGHRPDPSGVTDRTLAMDMERFAHFKTRNSCLSKAISDAIDRATIFGEAVLKTARRIDKAKYRTTTRILCQPDGTPYLTKDGDPIYQSDTWAEDPLPEGMPPESAPPAVQHLVKDRSMTFPAEGTYVWADRLIETEMILADEIRTEPVHFENFHAPTTVASLADAKSLYLEMTRPLSSIRREYRIGNVDMEQSTPAAAGKPKAVRDWLRHLFSNWLSAVAHADSSPKSPVDQPDPSSGEGPSHRSQADEAMLHAVECWRTVDIDGDGTPERVFLLLDLTSRRILWWDYAANVTPTGVPPFVVVRYRRKFNRWWGISEFADGKEDHEQVDYMLNRAFFANTFSGTLAGYDISRCPQFKDGPPVVGEGKWHQLAPDAKMEDAVSFAVMPKMGDDGLEFFNLLLQKHTLAKPAIQPGQQNVADLPASRLATGIKALTESADDLFAPLRSEATRCVQEVVKQHLEHLFFYMDQEEAFEYSEGESTLVGRLPKQLIQDLRFNVSLTMTKLRNLELKEKSEQARAMILEFHTQVPPHVQPVVAPFYADALRAMEYPDAKEYFKVVAPPPVTPQDLASAVPSPASPPAVDAGGAGAPLQPPAPAIEPL